MLHEDALGAAVVRCFAGAVRCVDRDLRPDSSRAGRCHDSVARPAGDGARPRRAPPHARPRPAAAGAICEMARAHCRRRFRHLHRDAAPRARPRPAAFRQYDRAGGVEPAARHGDRLRRWPRRGAASRIALRSLRHVPDPARRQRPAFLARPAPCALVRPLAALAAGFRHAEHGRRRGRSSTCCGISFCRR